MRNIGNLDVYLGKILGLSCEIQQSTGSHLFLFRIVTACFRCTSEFYKF